MCTDRPVRPHPATATAPCIRICTVPPPFHRHRHRRVGPIRPSAAATVAIAVAVAQPAAFALCPRPSPSRIAAPLSPRRTPVAPVYPRRVCASPARRRAPLACAVPAPGSHARPDPVDGLDTASVETQRPDNAQHGSEHDSDQMSSSAHVPAAATSSPTQPQSATLQLPKRQRPFRVATLPAVIALLSQLVLASLAVFVSLAAQRRLIAAILAALALAPLLALTRRLAAILSPRARDDTAHPQPSTDGSQQTSMLATVLDDTLAPQFDALHAAITRLRAADPTSSASDTTAQPRDTALSGVSAAAAAVPPQHRALLSSLRVVENALSLVHAARDAHAATTARLRATEADLAARSADTAALLQLRRDKAASDERASDADALRARLAASEARTAALQSELLAATRATERARIEADEARAEAVAAREAAELAVAVQRDDLEARERELERQLAAERERRAAAGPLDRLRESVAGLTSRRDNASEERSVRQEEQAFWQGRLRGRTLGNDSVVLDELSARTARAAAPVPPTDPLGNVRRGGDAVAGGLPADGGFGAPTGLGADDKATDPAALPSTAQPATDEEADGAQREDNVATDPNFKFSREEFATQNAVPGDRVTSPSPSIMPLQAPSMSPPSPLDPSSADPPPPQTGSHQPNTYLDSLSTPQAPRRGVRAPLLETDRKPRRDGDESSVTTVSPGEGSTGGLTNPSALKDAGRGRNIVADVSKPRTQTAETATSPVATPSYDAGTQVTPPKAQQESQSEKPSQSEGGEDKRAVNASPPAQDSIPAETPAPAEEESTLPPVRSAIKQARAFMRSGRQWGRTQDEASAAFQQAETLLRDALEQLSRTEDGDAAENKGDGEKEASVDEVQGELGGCLVAWAKTNLSVEGSHERLVDGLCMLEARLECKPDDGAALFNAGLCLCLQAAVAKPRTKALELYGRAVGMYDRLVDVDDSSIITTFNAGLACVSLARTVDALDAESESERDADGDGKAGKGEGSWSEEAGRTRLVELLRKACRRFERVLQLRPGDGKAESYLRDCRTRLKEVEATRTVPEQVKSGEVKNEKNEEEGEESAQVSKQESKAEESTDNVGSGDDGSNKGQGRN